MSVTRASTRADEAHAGIASSAKAGQSSAGRLLRRRVVVDWREQLRGSALSITLVASALLLMNVSLYVRRSMTIDGLRHAGSPIRRALEQARFSDAVFTLVLSIVILVAVVGVKLLETHRVEGPVVNLVRRIKEVEQGHYRGVAKLRKGDRLQPVADALNSMIVGIRDRARHEIKELEELALRAKRVDSKYAAKDLSDQIAKFAEKTHRHFD
ncbi:MAG: hypothetical protein OEQ13_08225 [Acidobacteriota bacterium]|nr:hypothetical protein [Acidobacteriota bacterium]